MCRQTSSVNLFQYSLAILARRDLRSKTQDRKASSSSGSSEALVCAQSEADPSASLSSDRFALLMIEALCDPTVIGKIREACRMDYDEIADRVQMRLRGVIQKLEDELEVKDRQIFALEKRVAAAELQLDEQEQYSRRTSVRIAGLEEEENENIQAKVEELFTAMDASTTINRVHRVGPRNSVRAPSGAAPNPPKPRGVLCQFTSYLDKVKVMRKRKEIRHSHPEVFINEDLTRIRSKLLYLARQKKREKRINDAWSADGRIIIKDNANKIHLIQRVDDLNKLATRLPTDSPSGSADLPTGSSHALDPLAQD